MVRFWWEPCPRIQTQHLVMSSRGRERALIPSESGKGPSPFNEGSTSWFHHFSKVYFLTPSHWRLASSARSGRHHIQPRTHVLWEKHIFYSITIAFIFVTCFGNDVWAMRWTPFPSKALESPCMFLSALLLFSFCLKQHTAHTKITPSSLWAEGVEPALILH